MKIKIKKPEIKLTRPKAFKLTIPNISLRNVRNLVMKELYNFFTQPIGYIISVLFLFVFLVIVFAVNRFTEYGTSDLSSLFGYLAFILVITVPAITMGSFSKERANGTLEFLLTRPIREIELVIAKVLGNSIIVTLLTLLTLPFTILVSTYTQLDFGQVVMQYIGAIVLGISLVSLGVAISSMFKNEIGAFLTTLIISALLILIGSNVLIGGDVLSVLPQFISEIIERLSLSVHYQSISKGVIDLRDLFYFVAFISTFIVVSFYFIKRDKLPQTHIERFKTRNLVIFFFVLTFAVGYLGQQLVGRIDLTSNKLYTLSDSSINAVNNAKEIITLDFYRSSGLPLDYQPSIRSIENLLSDYRNYSVGKLVLNFKDPASSDSIKSEAESEGLLPINFTSQNSNSAQVVGGYLGIVIKYKDKKDSFSLIDLNNGIIITNPEYELTKRLRKLTNENLSNVAFVSNNVDGLRNSNLVTFNNELSALYNVSDLELKADTVIPSDISTLIIPGPNAEFETGVVDKLKQFYTDGGSIFLLSSTLTVGEITQPPTENLNSLATLFEDYGVKVNSEMVYDLENQNSVRLQSYLYPIKYPFWIISKKTNADISILNSINQLSLLWPNSISIENKPDVSLWELIKSSNASNVEVLPNINLAVDRQFQYNDSDSSKTIAVAIENKSNARAVIVADWKLLSETFELVQVEDNLNFGISAVEWLTKEDGLSEVKAKDRTPKRIILNDSQSASLVAVSAILPILSIVGIYALQTYLRKKWNQV